LNEEAERLGLKRIRRLFTIQDRQIEESLGADFLLAPSRIVRDSFIDRGYDVNRIAVLPYGVDLNHFHPIAEHIGEDRTFRVICVAQISSRKGHVYLLEAWKKLNLPNAELLLIGTISQEMRSIVSRYTGIFRHISSVPNQHLFELYGRSSVFVLPTLEDGFAVVTGEAMACGLPVITTVNNGAADVIEHGKDGFIIPIRSSGSIAEHIELLYRNRPFLQAMSEAALVKARNELGWDRYADRLCDLYHSLLESSGQQILFTKTQTAEAS